jgi:hypothetical protein
VVDSEVTCRGDDAVHTLREKNSHRNRYVYADLPAGGGNVPILKILALKEDILSVGVEIGDDGKEIVFAFAAGSEVLSQCPRLFNYDVITLTQSGIVGDLNAEIKGTVIIFEVDIVSFKIAL